MYDDDGGDDYGDDKTEKVLPKYGVYSSGDFNLDNNFFLDHIQAKL